MAKRKTSLQRGVLKNGLKMAQVVSHAMITQDTREIAWTHEENNNGRNDFQNAQGLPQLWHPHKHD
jgi:hypothetical protein